MHADLPIGPGQNVLISGDPSLAEPPSWGSGGFTVQPLGSLALSHVALLAGDDDLGGQLAVQAGGRLSVADSLLMPSAAAAAEWMQPVPLPCDGGPDGQCRGPHAGAVVLTTAASVSLAVPLVCGFWTDDCAALPGGVSAEQRAAGLAAGVAWNADAVCFLHGAADAGVEERQALEREERAGALTAAEAARLQTARWAAVSVPDDPNFLVSADGGSRCDDVSSGQGPFGLNRSATGPRWYRLPAGRGLPTAPPGEYHCGTDNTGWLSGWPAGAEGQPGDRYATPADGSLPPPVGRPPAAGTVCFEGTGRATCISSTAVRAVACGAFNLWELAAAPGVNCYGYCLGAA